MARAKIPEAGPRHPARKILKERTAQEVADALGLGVASIKAAKRDLKVTMADRIVEAFGGKASDSALSSEAGKEEAPPAPGGNSAFVTGDHPAWDVIDKYSAAEIAERCKLTMETIEHIAEGGLRPALANKIAAAFRDEERMKDAIRTASPCMQPPKPPAQPRPEELAWQEEPPSAAPVKTWIDESVKKPLSPSFDFLRSLLAVGGYIIVPITPRTGGQTERSLR